MFNVNAAVRWTARAPRVPRMPRAPRAPIGSALIRMAHYQLAADSSHDSPRTLGLLAFSKTAARRRWACSPCAGTPLLKRSVGTRGAASMQDTRCPKEPHAQRSWPLHSAVTVSAVRGSICEQKRGWPSLSDDGRLVEEPVTARRWTSRSSWWKGPGWWKGGVPV